MTEDKGPRVRFSLLTALVWLLVAAGIIFLLWQVINRISASDLPLSTPTANLTQVYQTISAVLTAQPSTTPTKPPPVDTTLPTAAVTVSPSTPLVSPRFTPSPSPPVTTATPLVLCNQAAAGNPIDVTIPDDSLIAPGQNFIKTWKLVNAGTCTWTTDYSASFFYGDDMDAPASMPLPEEVLPSHSVEISVEMVAPEDPGTYQGNWKLEDPDGTLFGIGPNGDSPFWVRIVVKESQTATPTATSGPSPTSTPTSEVTSTSTPEGQLSGELIPMPGDAIDLDTLTLDSGGEDLVYRVETDQYHWLTPTPDTSLGVYGSQAPELENCQQTNMSSAPIAVESLPIGTYLCYHTGEGRFGRMMLAAVDPTTFALTLDLLTWALP